MTPQASSVGPFFLVGWDDGAGTRGTTLYGGGGAGPFFVVGRDDGEEARGTKLNGGGISVSFNSTSSGGADTGGLWSSSSWISNPGLRLSQILFIQGVESNLINVIQQPSRWY